MRPRQKASRVDFPCKGGIRGLGNRYRALFQGKGKKKKGRQKQTFEGKAAGGNSSPGIIKRRE